MSDPNSNATERASSEAAPVRQLTVFDSTCIIVGIIIGAGIYETTPLIAMNVPNVGWLIGVWFLGGLLSFLGALCYAELATAYPKQGGDYVYLTRAFGRRPGFLFAWAQLWVVRPGSIGAMAYIFGRYANELWPLTEQIGEAAALMTYAAASVVVLSAINIVGVRQGKWTQNLLTTVKVLGLVAICVVGFCLPGAETPPAAGAETAEVAETAQPDGEEAAEAEAFDLSGFFSSVGLAVIFVLFTYGGWNEMAYVGAEVRNPEKNILRALVLGTVGVTVIYLLVTLAFLRSLGFDGIRNSSAVAVDVLEPALGDWAGRVISVLICISALGAANGNIFTGARIYYAMGTEHRIYRWLGKWSPRRGTPVPSLLIQAAITVALIVWFGRTERGFQGMVIFTTPVFWTFLFLVGISLFRLRSREPQTPRPYRVPLYPLVPIVFCLSSAFMVYSSLDYAFANRSWEAIWSILILLAGVAMCFFDPRPASGSRQAP